MKTRVSLDTCVFVKLFEFDKIYRENGIEALKEQIKESEIQRNNSIENLKKVIDFLVSKNEYKSAKDFSFEKQIDYFSNIFKKSKDIVNKKLFSEVRSKYENFKDTPFAGKLFEHYLNGEVEFIITPSTKDEIDYHRASNVEYRALHDEESKKRDKGIHKFSDESVDNLFTHCTILRYKNEQYKETINKISEILRGIHEEYNKKLNEKLPALRNEMNRMGFYSDANIMAESQETGSILVTSNTKHFIFYEINKFNENGSINPARREMIRKIFTLLGLNKNCLPYSLEETIQILEEKAKDRNNEEDLNKEKVQGNNKNKKEETVQTKRIKAEENDYGCFEREF